MMEFILNWVRGGVLQVLSDSLSCRRVFPNNFKRLKLRNVTEKSVAYTSDLWYFVCSVYR